MNPRLCVVTFVLAIASACLSSDDGTLDATVTDTGAIDTMASSDATSVATTAPVDTAVPADTTPADTADTSAPTDASPSDVAAPPADPGVAGPFTVTKSSRTLAGFAVDVYTPSGASPLPLVLLSPGFLLEAKSFATTGQHLASHGYAVVIPTWGDNAFAPISHSTLADHVSALLDALLAAGATPSIDPARVGVAGHSRGGKITILAATRDDRIGAVFGLDPVDAVGPLGAPTPDNPSVTPELMAGLVVPFAVIGSAKGGELHLGTTCAPTADNYRAYHDAATAAPARHLWVPTGSGHNDFGTDLGLLALACKTGDDAAATRAFAHAKLVAFFRVYLDGDARYAAWL